MTDQLRSAAQAVVDWMDDKSYEPGRAMPSLNDAVEQLRAALDAVPPAGLRVTDVLRVLADLEAREEAHPLGKPFAQVRGAVLSLASLTGADAAPSCGHPLDADRLKLRLSRAAEGNVYLDIAHVCDLIDQEAAAYAGEGE